MHGQSARQTGRVDHGDVGDDDVRIAQPPQTSRHRRFRQADLFPPARAQAGCRAGPDQQSTIKGIRSTVSCDKSLYDCLLASWQAKSMPRKRRPFYLGSGHVLPGPRPSSSPPDSGSALSRLMAGWCRCRPGTSSPDPQHPMVRTSGHGGPARRPVGDGSAGGVPAVAGLRLHRQ